MNANTGGGLIEGRRYLVAAFSVQAKFDRYNETFAKTTGSVGHWYLYRKNGEVVFSVNDDGLHWMQRSRQFDGYEIEAEPSGYTLADLVPLAEPSEGG